MAARPRRAQRATDPTRRALLVALSDYPKRSGFKALPGVTKDAERLEHVLRNRDICTLHDLEFLVGRKATRAAIFEAFDKLASEAGESDQIILYFGGHAHRERDATHTHWNYWFLPYDATPANIREVGLSSDDFATLLGKLKAREVVLILDVCFARGITGFPWSGFLLERLHQRKASHFILCATLEDEDEPDTRAGGLFVQALCDALEGQYVTPDPGGRVSIQQAWLHAAAAVEAKTGRDHQQSVALAIGAPIYITRLPKTRPSPVVGIYPRSEHTLVFDMIRELIPAAKNMLLVGTGLSVVWEAGIPRLLLQRARERGVRIDICLANPRNPSVRSRLVEERMWKVDPPLNRRGIRGRITHLVGTSQRQASTGRMRVRIFEHYPTMATLIFDNDIFVYPYAFHVLGTSAPIMHMHDDGSEEVRFYRENARRIFDAAIPAESALNAWRNDEFFDPEWIAAAVYLIPEANHPLYTFGSAVLGYDIYEAGEPDRRSRAPLLPPRYVGDATQYGFHVTLGDALYFHPATLDRVEAELRVLAAEFKPFDLSAFHLPGEFHGNPRTLALRCEDPSGNAEALHHEIIARFNSLALSSTYRAGQATEPPAQRTARERYLIERFGAPYILGEFDPHFTLGTNLPANETSRRRIVDRLNAAFRAAVGEQPRFRADTLFLVTREPGEHSWTIRQSFALSG